MTYGFNSISRSLILAGALAFGALPAFAQSGTSATVGASPTVQTPAASTSATVGAKAGVSTEKKADEKAAVKGDVKTDSKAAAPVAPVAKDKQSSNTKVEHKGKIMHRADATPAKKEEVKPMGKIEAKPAAKVGEKPAAAAPVEKKAEPSGSKL